MAGSGNRNNRGRRKYGASSQGTTKRRNQNRRPRSNKRTTKKRRAGAPAWVWFLSGLALATAAAAIAYIVVQPAPSKMTARRISPESNAATSESVPTNLKTNAQSGRKAGSHAAAESKSNHKADRQPRFEFYRMLPDYDAGYEATTPASDTAGSPGGSNNRSRQDQVAQQSGTNKQNAETSQTARAGSSGDGPWRIQVGAFSTRSSARKRLAQLTLLGLGAGISKQTLESGDTLYRVHTKQINSRQRLDEVRSKLAAHDIELLVRHVGS